MLSLLDGTMVVGRVESIEVEVRARARFPKTQVVGVIRVEAGDGSIVGHGEDLLAALPLGSLGVAILVLLRGTVETNLIRDVLALNLPRVAVVQPKIGNLDLVTILNLLLKDAVVVSNTVAPGGDLESGERVNEARGKSTQTTVTKSGVGLKLVELLQIVAHFHESFLELLLHVNVDEGVLESTTHEELKRQIVNSLDILVLVVGLSVVPGLEESVTNGEGGSLVSTKVVEVETGASKSVLDVVHDLLLDVLLAGGKVSAHELPHLFLTLLGGRRVLELRLK